MLMMSKNKLEEKEVAKAFYLVCFSCFYCCEQQV